MPGKVRRIVTAVNEAGRSYIQSDIELPLKLEPNEPLRAAFWVTDSTPATNVGPDPVPDGIYAPTPPPKGGTVVRITEYPPDSQRERQPSAADRPGRRTTPDRSAKHPGFHATDTIDYAVVLEGEIWAVMDEGETLMRAGDVLIQRGTFHAWANRSDRNCRILFVLIDAEPLVGH